MKTTNQIKNMFTDDQGAVAIITALVILFVLLGVAALAIDIGKQTTTKNELQNAVDTAALAGARELGVQGNEEEFDINEVKDAAINAAYENKADNNPVVLVYDDVTLGRWEEPDFLTLEEGELPNAVLVRKLGYEFNNFFARIFKINTGKVSAEAIAIIGPAGGGIQGLIPFALTQTAVDELLENDESDRDIYFMFQPGDMVELAAGNWGTVNFDGPGAANDKLTNWTKNGYDGVISVGDEIWTAPSAHVNSGPMKDALDYRIGEGHEVIVPIITFPEGVALGSDIVVVSGFAAVKIVSRTGMGAFMTVQITFLHTVDPGIMAPKGSGDFGVRSIALVQ